MSSAVALPDLFPLRAGTGLPPPFPEAGRLRPGLLRCSQIPRAIDRTPRATKSRSHSAACLPSAERRRSESCGLLCGSPARLEVRRPSKIQEARESWAAAQAQRKADEEVATVARLAEVKAAEEALTTHLTTTGETAEFACEVVQLMKTKERRLLKAVAGEHIDEAAVEPFCHQVKRAMFGSILRKYFPSHWRLSDLQKETLIDSILIRHSSSDSSLLAPRMSLFVAAVQEELNNNAGKFHCPICMDPLVTVLGGDVDSSNVWFAPIRKTEHWSNHPCGHACCRSCMATWAETAISEQKPKIRCPAVGCSYCLWDHEVQGLVSEQAFEHHQEHKNADYLRHLKHSVKQDPSLRIWLKAHARPCPECHVIVSRSEGCNHMMCVCGTNFCYDCGFVKCKCNSRRRADIWNPKT